MAGKFSFLIKLVDVVDIHITGSATAIHVEEANPRMFNNSVQCGGIRTPGTLINRRSNCPWYV